MTEHVWRTFPWRTIDLAHAFRIPEVVSACRMMPLAEATTGPSFHDAPCPACVEALGPTLHKRSEP